MTKVEAGRLSKGGQVTAKINRLEAQVEWLAGELRRLRGGAAVRSQPAGITVPPVLILEITEFIGRRQE